MTESDFDFVCKRCLNDTEKVGTTQVIAVCSRCGVENWCFEVPRAKQGKSSRKGEEEIPAPPVKVEAKIEVEPVEETEEEEQEVEVRTEDMEPEIVAEEEPADEPEKGPTKREIAIAKKRAELEELEKSG